MARRSDAALLSEYQQRQEALARRMCRKDDPLFVKLERVRNGIMDVMHELHIEGMLEGREKTLAASQDELDKAARERLADWCEKNNATPRMF